jgi:hypothetical protein
MPPCPTLAPTTPEDHPMPAGTPTSFRLSDEARAMLDGLEAHLGLKRTAVIEYLIRERFRAEGLARAVAGGAGKRAAKRAAGKSAKKSDTGG